MFKYFTRSVLCARYVVRRLPRTVQVSLRPVSTTASTAIAPATVVSRNETYLSLSFAQRLAACIRKEHTIVEAELNEKVIKYLEKFMARSKTDVEVCIFMETARAIEMHHKTARCRLVNVYFVTNDIQHRTQLADRLFKAVRARLIDDGLLSSQSTHIAELYGVLPMQSYVMYYNQHVSSLSCTFTLLWDVSAPLV
jgi:phage anti-repressor protein